MDTFRELYYLYTGIYRADRSETVKRNYRYAMEKHFLSKIGDRKITDMTITEVQMILNEMSGMAQTTIRSVFNDLKLIYRHAYIDGILCRDMSPYLSSPKGKKGEFRRALTPEEREAVLSVAPTKRKYHAFLFMLLCGCRPGEAYAIKKEDLDYDKETVHIRGTKTELSDRTIPCPTDLLEMHRNSPQGLLTASEEGLRVTQEMQRRIWHSFYIDCHQFLGGHMYRNAPCEPFPFGTDLTAYNLRHEYCTELARQGVDLRVTQKLMGHSSPEMVLRVYTNLTDQDVDSDQVRRAINNYTLPKTQTW